MTDLLIAVLDTGTSGGIDISATNDDGDRPFYAPCKVQVVEVGCHVTTDAVQGAASAVILMFDKTTASVGASGSETAAPARAEVTAARLVGSSSNVTVQDGKVYSLKTDFNLEKGDVLTAESGDAPTSGRVIPYILYRIAGQSAKEAGEQRSAEAAE